MMSWAGGWFFLMAAEIFTVGQRDFRLPGLGAYLSEAASTGNVRAIGYGVVTLILVIVALDQLVWRPLLAWADRFKLELVESAEPQRSWFYNALMASRLFAWLRGYGHDWLESIDVRTRDYASPIAIDGTDESVPPTGPVAWLRRIVVGGGLIYGIIRAVLMLAGVSAATWGQIAVGAGATMLRVAGSLAIALAWTVPVGVAIGLNQRLARWCQPIVQIAASVPATALFPVFLLAILKLAGGMNLAAILLMLMGTQWYLLFNVIAGATAIPQDLKYTTALLNMRRLDRWRTLILPSLFPISSPAPSSTGGAWNASIVAEYARSAAEPFRRPDLGR